MKKALILIILLVLSSNVFAQNEVGPEGQKLFWFLLILMVLVMFLVFVLKPKVWLTSVKNFLFQRKKVEVQIKTDRRYYPDFMDLTIKNTGNTDVDISQPLLIFDNFWLKRKFKLKGTNKYNFYPLYLEKGKTHALRIDINRFYRHDNRLKKFPKARIIISEVKGKRLGAKSVFLRKTLVKF